jgi:hypothetical protein
MSTLKTLAIAAALIAILAPAKADSPMKWPNWYAYQVASMEKDYGGGFPYFQCDYTSRICVSGKISDTRGMLFVGVILAEDRRTVLKHIVCWENLRDCNDYDEGIQGYNLHPEFQSRAAIADMPAYCVEAMRQRGERCRGYDKCYAGWKCSYSSNH